MKIIEYSKNHYYKYTDFFRFIDKFTELNIFMTLFLTKEEKELIDILKKIVIVKNNEIFDLIKDQNNKDNMTLKSPVSLKVKASNLSLKEKLKKYFNSIINKENQTTFEHNFKEYFDCNFTA